MMERRTQISNPELRNLDERTAEFYKLSDRYFNAISNLHGREMYKKELSDILRIAERVRPKSEFDELVFKNIQSNLTLNNRIIDFVSDPNFSLSVEQFLDKIAGKGTWKYLEERLRDPLWKKRWEYSAIIQERDFSRVDPFVKEAQEAARDWLPILKKDILKYGKSSDYLPKDFDMTIFLLPPKEGGESSSWNPKTKVLSLGSYGFDFFRKRGKVIAVPTRAYKIAFHEILGHAAHQINSDDLPLSLRLTGEIDSITPTKSVVEGFTIDKERQSYDFLRKNLERLGITEKDLQILEMEDEIKIQGAYEDMYCALLKDKELREKKFDGYKFLLNLTNNPVIARTFREHFKDRFLNRWQCFGHTFGKLHYGNMKDRVKWKFGKDYLEKNKEKFHKATARGVWAWEVYPDAVCYFLREKN